MGKATKATIDEIEAAARLEADVDTSSMTILPSGEVVVDEELRACNVKALAELAEARKGATY